MARRRLCASGVVACLLLLPAAVRAQNDVEAEQYYGRTVTAIRFEVQGRPNASPDHSSLIDVRLGQPLRREDVRSSMNHLNELTYEQITPVVTATPGGVAVTFRLVPRYPVNRVEIAPGDTGSVSAGVLRDEIGRRFSGVVVRPAVVEDFVQRFLNDEGYLSAEASATTSVDPDSGRATLVVTVRAGPVSVIGRSDVKGTSPLPASDVLRRTQAQAGQPFRRREIELRLTEIEDDLGARGYYQAQATLEATPAASGVDVVIAIETGPRVVLQVEPSGTLPGREDDLIPIKRLRSADQDLLEDAKAAIERALQRNGYADAAAPFSRAPSADGSTVAITFTINRGPRFFVDRVDFAASLNVPLPTLRDLIGIRPGDVYAPIRFEAGLGSVMDEYRRRGYYQSKAEPRRETVSARSNQNETWIILDPNITEGTRGQVAEIAFSFEGPHTVAESELRTRLQSRAGAPYVEQFAVLDQDALIALYRDRGFLTAAVGLEAKFANGGADVSLAFRVNEGPRIVVGRVTVLGNQNVSEQQILEVVQLTPGQPLSATATFEARQRLLAMGVFSRATVTSDRIGGEPDAHVVVNVTESPNVTGGFGFGLEGGTRVRATVDNAQEDYVYLSPRASYDITRRNLGGRNRAISLLSRVSLKPRSAPDNPEEDGRGFGFSEYRAAVTYREQRVFRSDTDVLAAVTSEQAVRSTYSSLRRGINAEFLRRLSPRVNASGRYALDFTRLFDERILEGDRLLIDRLFPQVRLSIVSTGVTWDGRDNLLAPTRGSFLSADAEIAARALGSQVGYIKTFYQASNFRPLGGGTRTVLAVRGQMGLAKGFARTVPILENGVETSTRTVEDLPVSQRFFAGGGTTVRGFQLDRLGVFDPSCALAEDPTCPSVIDKTTGLSLGGNARVVLNAEVRRVLGRLFDQNLAVVGFVDAGNIFARASYLNISKIRGTLGLGVRYDSPLGPIRLDFGFKMSRLTVGDTRESGWEYHLSIGEAF